MSTRVADLVEVGHGVNVVVLTLLREHTATVLTASQAERLGVYLIRQAAHARAALAASPASAPELREVRQRLSEIAAQIREHPDGCHGWTWPALAEDLEVLADPEGATPDTGSTP